MTPLEIMQQCTKFAVVGLKNDPEKYVYRIYKRLLNEGYETYAVSDYIDEIDGTKVYKTIKELPAQIEVVVFVVAPKNGYKYVEECKELNIPYLWLQPGTYDNDFLLVLENNQITYYVNCILRRLDELKK